MAAECIFNRTWESNTNTLDLDTQKGDPTTVMKLGKTCGRYRMYGNGVGRLYPSGISTKP
jgi:hypothetical protein